MRSLENVKMGYIPVRPIKTALRVGPQKPNEGLPKNNPVGRGGNVLNWKNVLLISQETTVSPRKQTLALAHCFQWPDSSPLAVEETDVI